MPPRDRDAGTERDHRERQEGGEHREDRGDHVDGAIRERGRDALLEEELHAVGQRDQDAEGARAVRSDPRLHVGDDLALHPDHEEHGEEQRREHHDHAAHEEQPVDPVHLGRLRRGRGRLALR